MPEITNLHELLLHELQDCYSFEEQLTAAIPKLAKACENEDVRAALEEHLTGTESQMERVGALIASLGEKPGKVKCAGMAGIIKEGQEIIKEAEGPARDVGIIAAAQRVEHYEIAVYGSVKAYAKQLGLQEAMTVLEAIENEEKAADEKLSELSVQINQDAHDAGGEEEGGEGGDNERSAGESSASRGRKPQVKTRSQGGASRTRR